VIGTNLAIVGSANFSTNGLNIQEEEFDGWQEAGYGTDKADDLQGMREWFDGQWGRGVEITSDLLAQAQAVWAARFRNRISRSAPNRSVLSMSYEEVKGRNIYVAFYLDEASSEAEKVFASLKQGYELDSPKPNGAELGFFEDWDGMRQGQKVISVRVGPRGGVDVEGVYEIIDVIQKVRSKGPSKGERMTLQMCHRIVNLADRPFKKHECNEFADRLRTSGWSLSNDERYAFVPLEQLITEI
jgi:hypothetical protein